MSKDKGSKSMFKFLITENQYFMNLTSVRLSHLAR